MKKAIKIFTTVALILAILVCSIWYLFVYDRDFTRDVLLSCARSSERNGNHTVAAWFYDLAYAQSGNNDAVAIELANQYRSNGNYTKAEYTLYNAISNGGGIDVYIALSKLYVEQDKLLDAVTMLNNVTNEKIKAELDKLRPTAPSATPEPATYNAYISVSITSNANTIYYTTDGEYPSTSTGPYKEAITLPGGETKIAALSIDENGLVSPLANLDYVVGNVIELVEFKDKVIEDAVRIHLNLPADTPIYTNDLWTIKEFTVPSNATDYSDIPHFTFLEKLTINSGKTEGLNHIGSLENLTSLTITKTVATEDTLIEIAALPKLMYLTLSDCGLYSITALNKCANLIELDLSNNSFIDDLSPVASMKHLQRLNLEGNNIKDVSDLAANTELTYLNLSTNQRIESLEAITSLAKLTELYADTNSINTLSGFEKMKALTKLSLAHNKIADAGPLSGCSALTDLNISFNLLTNIDGLASLSALMDVDISNNQIERLPAWNKACSLVKINGANNSIDSIVNLSGLEHLNIVIMDDNKDLQSVDALKDCPMLINVSVFGTGVTDIRVLKVQGIIVGYDPY